MDKDKGRIPGIESYQSDPRIDHGFPWEQNIQ